MRYSWTRFAASFALLCSSMFASSTFATAAEPVSGSDARAIYEQYYQRALQTAPYDLAAPQVTLLLPGEPLLTAALSAAESDDKIAAEVSPSVVAQLAKAEGMPPEPQDEDYDWYASQVESSAEASSAEFEDQFAYGYEHEYDYGYEDFDYNPHLSQSSAEKTAAEEAEATLAANEPAEPIEDIELQYGYDANGRPIHTAMSESAIVEASSDYTRGYSVYDDQLADEYLRKYHELLHGEEFVAAPAPAQSVASQVIEVAQQVLSFDWHEHALALGQETLASEAWQELLAQAQAAQQHPNTNESPSAALDQEDEDYALLECEEKCFSNEIVPCYPLVVETEPVDESLVELPEVAEVEVDALLQIAHTLDRAGLALQQWSHTLSDWACQYEASRFLQSRRTVESGAR